MRKELFIKRKNVIAAASCIIVFLLAALIFNSKYLPFRHWIPSTGGILHLSIIIFWMFYSNKHNTNKRMRHQMNYAAGLMMLWLVLRELKYNFMQNPDMVRYAWYAFYIPMTYIPLLFFYSILNIGVPQEAKINWKWYLLMLPALALVILFLTNDFHELCFHFPNGDKNSQAYSHEIIYWLEVAWIFSLLLSSLGLAIYKEIKPGYKKYLFLPFIPLGLGFIYFIAYFTTAGALFNLPETFCFIIISYWETLSILKLVPLFDGYQNLFRSQDDILITDKEYNIRYRTGERGIDRETLIAACDAPVMLDENMRLSSRPIQGGYAYFTENQKRLNAAREQLEEKNQELKEYNILLEERNALRIANEKIKEKSRLYDNIYNELKNEIQFVHEALSKIHPEDPDFEDSMKRICIYNSYIKRMSNLILLSLEGDLVSAQDFSYSVYELLDYLKLAGIPGAYRSDYKGHAPGRVITELFKITGQIILKSLKELSGITIIFTEDMTLRILTETKKLVIFPSLRYFALEADMDENEITYIIRREAR